MLHRESFCVSVMIVVAVCFTKLSIFIVKLLFLHIPKVFFKIVIAIIVEGFTTKNVSQNENNNTLNAGSSDSAYESAEEETLDDFHDSHQYVRWDLPSIAEDFYPISSLFALHGIPYIFRSSIENDLGTEPELTKEKRMKSRKPKISWEKNLLRGIQCKRASTSSKYDSDSLPEPKPVPECSESKEPCKSSLLHEIPSERVSAPLKAYSYTSFECKPTEHRVIRSNESRDHTFNKPHLRAVPSECISNLLKCGSKTSIESQSTKQQDIDCSVRFSLALRNDSNIPFQTIGQRVIDRCESRKTWKQQLLCCMSVQTDD